MACVTLKRPLDFDPLEALHSPNRPPTKRRRCTPIKSVDRDGLSLSFAPSCSSSATSTSTTANTSLPVSSPSSFRETSLTSEEVTNNLRDELKRMRRRRQLVPYESPSTPPKTMKQQQRRRPPSSPGSPEPMMDANTSSRSTASVSTTSSSSAPAVDTGAASSSSTSANSGNLNVPSAKLLMGTREKPVFTLKQMTIICERMCKERTDKVRQEYDRILHQKLSEQYDAFVKFIDHQIQQRYNDSQLPSYLS